MEFRGLLTSIMIAAVITYKSRADEPCTRGFMDPYNVELSEDLSPLLNNTVREQWIFPSMEFTCNGNLTEWIFRGVGSHTSDPGLRLTTWRLDPSIPTYRRVSFTNYATADIIIHPKKSVITYKLTSPVEVQTGDIAGIELLSVTGRDDNVLSLDTRTLNGTSPTLSYRRTTSLKHGFRLRFGFKRTSLPLLSVVFEGSSYDILTSDSPPSTMASTTPSTGAGVSLSAFQWASILGCAVGVLVTVSLCVFVACLARHAPSWKTIRRACTNSIRHTQRSTSNSRLSLIPMQDNTAYKVTEMEHSTESWREVRFDGQSQLYETISSNLDRAQRREFFSEYSLMEHEGHSRPYAAGRNVTGQEVMEFKEGKDSERDSVRSGNDEYVYADEKEHSMWTQHASRDT